MEIKADLPREQSQAPQNIDEGHCLLVRWLVGRDAKCPVCGYNLRGLFEPRCPECGAGIELAVASPDSKFGWWVVAQVFLAMAMGFDAVVALLILMRAMASRPTTPATI